MSVLGVDIPLLFKKVNYEDNTDHILSAQQVDHFYSLVKNESLKDSNYPNQMSMDQLYQIALKTLKVLMVGLILTREFQIIKDSYQLKYKLVFGGNDGEAKGDLLARILLRCK